MGLSVEAVKGLVLGGLFLMTFIFSSIPIKFYDVAHDHDSTHHRRGKRAISFLSCFAAGVFLATCLLHLFPDVDRSISQVMDRLNIFSSFPVSEFVMIFGFFLILLVEQIVLTMKEKHESDGDDFFHHHQHSHHEDKPLLEGDGETGAVINRPPRYGYTNQLSSESFDANSVSSRASSDPFPTMTSSGEHNLPTEYSVHVDQSSHSTIRSLILLLALSLHAVFEGLAVGLQKTKDDVVQIFTALVLHKCIIGFSLGLNLVQGRLSRCATLRATFVFSIMSPLGIAVGMIIDDVTNSIGASAASGILQGIACGTFLYVTFFEVLPHEFNSKDDRMLKVLFLLLGFSTLVAILFFDTDKDDVPRCSSGRSLPTNPH